jgi:[acyl-carrier-protein] S-malonyltransferase
MTASNIAFLFPGQGSQSVGMGKDLSEKYPIARQTFEEADDALGYKLSQLCFEGPEDQLRLNKLRLSFRAVRSREAARPCRGTCFFKL